ncbi:glycosyltransferase family protein [Candidatus Peregrinibacteria bacterium]|nr:glycosyltransferase family protein [Candidatus Peregrinibacteria bacterium]
MKIVAIIQARMGSTRLPGKMMMTILDKPIIQWVFERVATSKIVNKLLLVTTKNSEDNILVQWAIQHSIQYFRGSCDDVLDRYYQAAQHAHADVVVRITGDCPLIDANVIDLVIRYYLDGNYDYVSNCHPPTYPDGLDVEVFSTKTLERAWKEAALISEREHVTPYIWEHPELFLLGNSSRSDDISKHRWTLDTQDDFNFIKKIFEACAVKHCSCGMDDVIALLKKYPDWLNINRHHERNEGYTKSLHYDRMSDSQS